MAPAGVQKSEEEEDDLWFESSGVESSEDEVDDREVSASATTSPRNDYSRTRPGGKKSGRGFTAGLVLTTPRMMQTSVSKIFEDVMSGDIDLEPDYQRSVVWPKAKQSAVIESLLSHYYIPPILLSSKQSESGAVYTCIDGKQRLSSIKLFMTNEIPVYDADGRSFFYDHPDKKKRSLPPEVAKRFRKEAIATVVYENLNDSEEREMFQRVQMGVTLSPAEKLSALRNKWTILFDELTKKFMDTDAQESLTHIVTAIRSQEWLFMAQICLSIKFASYEYVPHYSAIRTFIERDREGPSPKMQAEVKQALTRFLRLANDPAFNDCLLPQKQSGRPARKVSPVEFVQIGFMIWRFHDASYGDLARCIEAMRSEILRQAPGQIRMNSFCVNVMRSVMSSFKPHMQADSSLSSSRRNPAQRGLDSLQGTDRGHPFSSTSAASTASGTVSGEHPSRKRTAFEEATTPHNDSDKRPRQSRLFNMSPDDTMAEGAIDSDGPWSRLSETASAASATRRTPKNPYV